MLKFHDGLHGETDVTTCGRTVRETESGSGRNWTVDRTVELTDSTTGNIDLHQQAHTGHVVNPRDRSASGESMVPRKLVTNRQRESATANRVTYSSLKTITLAISIHHRTRFQAGDSFGRVSTAKAINVMTINSITPMSKKRPARVSVCSTTLFTCDRMLMVGCHQQGAWIEISLNMRPAPQNEFSRRPLHSEQLGSSCHPLVRCGTTGVRHRFDPMNRTGLEHVAGRSEHAAGTGTRWQGL